MKNLTILLSLLIVGAFPESNSVQAQDVPCSLEGYTYAGEYNGHTYFLSNDCEFAASASATAALTGGHLATIADAGEDAFVAAAAGFGLAWIGYNDVATEGTWVWETGETDTYTNWCPEEPNNCCGGEHWATTNWCGLGWNDLYDGIAQGDFEWCLPMVVEFDGVSGDDDCDGVSNCIDVCPGGDDSGPCTGEGWPLDVPADWICSNNNNSEKFMVCHEGNTICVSSNAVATHLAHGDFLGPCSVCEESDAFAAPFNNSPVEVSRPVSPDFSIYPNPSYGDFKIEVNQSGNGKIEIFNQNGQFIRSIDVKSQQNLNININEPGLYFIQLITDEQLITKKITVMQ